MAACPVGRVPPDMRKDGYFMKSMKRRLLSLFMAMVMVCSLVPGALAASGGVSISNAPSEVDPGASVTLNATIPNAPAGQTYTTEWTAPGVDILAGSTGNSVTVTAPQSGSFSVTVTVKGNDGAEVGSDTATISVKSASTPNVTKVTLNSTTLTFDAGATTAQELKATLEGTNAEGVTPTWSVSPAGVVSLSSTSGKEINVTPVANTSGADKTATITVQAGSQSATCGVTVKSAAIPATGIVFASNNKTTMQIGEKASWGYILSPTGATGEVTWDSSDPSVASVNTAGQITAIKSGTTTISVQLKNDPMKKDSATLTVNAPITASISHATGSSFIAGGTITLDLNVSSGADQVGFVKWNIKTSGGSDYVTINTASGAVTNGSASTTVGLKKVGTVTIVAQLFANSTSTQSLKEVEYSLTITSPLTITPGSRTLTYYGETVTLTAQYGNTTVNPTWTIKNASASNIYNNGYVTLSPNNNGSATVTALQNTTSATIIQAEYTNPVSRELYKAECFITVKYSTQINPSVTVYDGNTGYALTDDPDEGRDSIADQIDDWVEARHRNSGYYYTVHFDQAGNSANKAGYLSASTKSGDVYEYDDLADVIFEPTPLTGTTKSATASYNFTVEVYRNSSTSRPEATYSGTMTFNIKPGSDSSGDIVYSASLGQDVSFDVSDFEDFYNDKYSRGYLEYVTFGSSTANGTLYNEDGKSAGSSSYYVDPSSRQKGLDGIYFSPKSTMKKSTTVKISFTAYGTTRDNSGEGKAEGTVTIIYLNDSAKDITYNTTAGKVTLNAQDFIDAYKEATGSKTAPSNLTIEFQNVPSNGTLTYTGGSKDKDLTKSNVKSNRYTTKNSGSYRLAQLTYTGTKGKDTIEYIAYSGSTAQFTGKVVFNGTAAVPTDVVVTYGSTGGQAVRFSQNDFVSANSAMSKATKVRFVAPANGTLLMNGASASGVDIATTLLGTVTYQPKSGFNGQDKIIFAAYDASNNTVASGTVNITVIGNPTTGTTPGGTPGGVSDVSQFKDVSATAWYRDNLATLVRKGIITGKGDGKFDPLGTVTYGEALKMVLESCGYTAALGTGSQWAINYKNLAVSRGWISSDIDLNAAISRNATAELTAKVLGVSAVTSGSPFADEANGYAAALYYTSPQIFAGSPNPNGGKPLFKNSSPLLRQEVCAVICRVSDYHTQHTTNNMPDGI